MVCQKIITAYEQSLHNSQLYYQELLDNCEKTDKTANQLIFQTEEELQSTRQNLTKALIENEQTKAELNDAHNQLTFMRQSMRRKGFFIGAVSFISSFLLAGLVF